MKVKRTEEVDVQQFRVGDIIHFELSDGEKVEMLAVKEEDEGMIFCSSDCLEKECRMNRKNTNAGGWDASYLRKKLNGEILDRRSGSRCCLLKMGISCVCRRRRKSSEKTHTEMKSLKT